MNINNWIASKSFWKSSTGDRFKDAHDTLVIAGVEKNVIFDVLDSLHGGMQTEYGE